MENRIFEHTYRILREIGRGGMSTVYLAEHLRLGTQWAVKQVRKNQIRRFDVALEANILKRLSHPMLPRIIDIFEDPEYIYIVEDYVAGISMEQYLARFGKVDEALAVEWFKAVCEALIYLHSRPNPIIYRDMKPSNIIVRPDGTLKLVDFGIAREYKSASTSDTTFVGTRGYAAPEQFGISQTDTRTDIYSLGVTMYHIVTGKSPYEPPYQFIPVRELDRTLSAGIEYILGKCIQIEPEDRYQSVNKIYDDLSNIHTFDSTYKRRKAMRGLMTAGLFVMFAASALLITTGIRKIAEEKDTYYISLITEAAGYDSAEYEQAIALLGQAEDLFPDEMQAYVQQAYVLYSADRTQDCIDYVTETLFPTLNGADENGELNAIVAAAYYDQEDYVSAAFYFKRSAASSELNIDQLRDYAVSVGRAGDINNAQDILEEILEMGASSETTDFVGGEIEYATGKFSEAEALFLSALGKTEDRLLRQRAYFSLAQLYRDVTQLPENERQGIENPATKEIDVIETAIEELSLQSNAVLYEMLGAAYYYRGMNSDSYLDLTSAARAFRQVLDLGIVKDYIYTNIFTVYQYAGDYGPAIEIMSEMKSAFPDEHIPYVYTAMIMILEENGKPEAQRDYGECYQEYLLAKEMVKQDDDTTQLQQLESLIDQLRDGGWLNGV